MRLTHMLADEIAAEVPIKTAPHAVHVVGTVLHVVVLNEEGLALHTVVVRLSTLHAARPAKVHGAVALDFRARLRSYLRTHALQVFVDEARQQGLLLLIEVRVRNAGRSKGAHLEFGARVDVLGGGRS